MKIWEMNELMLGDAYNAYITHNVIVTYDDEGMYYCNGKLVVDVDGVYNYCMSLI